MTKNKLGSACDAAPSQNFGLRSSDTIFKTASSIARPRYVITLTPGRGVDAIRSLRLLLKIAKRRFGLTAIDAFEDRSSPLEISNRDAADFKELRDEIIDERAQAWRRP